jgi:hypothetical protein
MTFRDFAMTFFPDGSQFDGSYVLARWTSRQS